jgi:hypothetical protein
LLSLLLTQGYCCALASSDAVRSNLCQMPFIHILTLHSIHWIVGDSFHDAVWFPVCSVYYIIRHLNIISISHECCL